MFFFGFQDRIRKIMLKGEKKICSFLCFWANELRIKTPEGNYAAIFIPQGLFVPLNSTRTKMNRFEVTGFIPPGQGLLLARGGGEALTSSKRCLKAVTGRFL